jgi:hypothetical protein
MAKHKNDILGVVPYIDHYLIPVNRPIGSVLLALARVVSKGLASILLPEFAFLVGLGRRLSLLGPSWECSHWAESYDRSSSCHQMSPWISPEASWHYN